MRRWLTVVVAGAAVMCASGAAQAQTASSAASNGPRSYAGVVAESAFGNVTSQSFGVEGGFAWTPNVVIFGEAGRVTDAAPSSLGPGAQQIASALGGQAAGVTFTVREPVTFFAAGVKYMWPTTTKFTPYVLAGLGAAQVKADAEFTINGTNVTAMLNQFGVVLGSDLAGTSTSAMVEGGAGVVYAITDRVYADAEFRYNRVFVSGAAIPFGRAGLGLGIRF